jgi:hypothetical protein
MARKKITATGVITTPALTALCCHSPLSSFLSTLPESLLIEVQNKKPRRIAPAGFFMSALGRDDYSSRWRFLRAAPRMSPSEAPESVEPY